MSGKQIDHLVKMANQIALNLGERRGEQQAAQKTGEHITRFWTPAMRAQLSEYRRAGGEGLSPAVARFLEQADGNSATD